MPQPGLGTMSFENQSSAEAEAEAAALLRMIEESHATAEEMAPADHVDPQPISIVDLTEDTLPDDGEDIDMVMVQSSPMDPSISLFPGRSHSVRSLTEALPNFVLALGCIACDR